MHALLKPGSILAALLVGTCAANASPLSATAILSGFNGVIFGDLSSTSDIEGPVVIGGNLSGGSHTFNNNPRSTPPAGFGAVTVYGNASGGPYNVNNGGNVYVGGSNSASFNLNGGHYLTSVPNTLTDFAAVGSGPNGLSAQLRGLAANSLIDATDHNNVQFNAAPVNGIAVFDLTAATLESYTGFTVNLNGASTVIVNVDASSTADAVSLSNHFLNESADRQNIIWNFYNATAVDFSTQWGGVMLADNATVTNSTDIEGVLVAQNFSGNGELHDYGFTGKLPPSTPVPEPAAALLFGVGLAGLGLVRHRKR